MCNGLLRRVFHHVIVLSLLPVGWQATVWGGAPTSSSPIAISSDDRWVWVVNPDNDSVSVIDALNDANTLFTEIPVGDGPARVAITPDYSKVYVTNQRSGTVSVIDAATHQVADTIDVGAEPVGCALRPDGNRLFVANFAAGTVSVIDTTTDQVTHTVEVGPKPRAIAVTDDKVYVTQFLAQLRYSSTPADEGSDGGKEGRVIVLNAQTAQILVAISVNPLDNVGFNSNGSVLGGIPPTNPATFTFPTGAFPNLLDSIVIRGGRAYLPNTASSPNGPFRFNVNVQSFLSVIDIATDMDSGQAINMNMGVQFEPPGQRLFITNPIAIAFKNGSDEGFVVSAATDRLVRVLLDANGAPTINAPLMTGDPGNVVRVEVGIDPPGAYRNSNPQGLVLNSIGTRAYVMNFISRDVSVVDISGAPATYHEMERVQSADLPTAGTVAAIVHRGNELFNTSIGPAGTDVNALPPAGRMSDFGWGTCYSCHPGGLHDGVTWQFPDGPRQSISMESTFSHPQSDEFLNANGAPLLPDFHQRALNWSAVRDEVQDFELNIRAVSGGQGLITDGQAVVNLQPTATTGRSADLDAIAAYIAFGILAPISPRRNEDVSEGRALFAQANCQSCHGGTNWTTSRIDFTPPPLTPPVVIMAGQLVAFLNDVGTFDPAALNEVRAVGTTIVAANGALGFNIPSLLSAFAGAPYLHSGAAPTLADVLDNVVHRAAGTAGIDTLSDADDREEVVRFLESIDEITETFTVVIVAANPPTDNPFVVGAQPFRDVLQTGATAELTQGIGGAGTPALGPIVYATINVLFSGTPAPLPNVSNIDVACTGSPVFCPSVVSLTGAGAGPYVISLSGPIPPGECTTLTFAGTSPGQKLQYQSQPGNVNMDAFTNTQDLLALIQALNDGTANAPANLARYNINRSTGANAVNTQDLIRLIHLLNGTNTTEPFNGDGVATCP